MRGAPQKAEGQRQRHRRRRRSSRAPGARPWPTPLASVSVAVRATPSVAYRSTSSILARGGVTVWLLGADWAGSQCAHNGDVRAMVRIAAGACERPLHLACCAAGRSRMSGERWGHGMQTGSLHCPQITMVQLASLAAQAPSQAALAPPAAARCAAARRPQRSSSCRPVRPQCSDPRGSREAAAAPPPPPPALDRRVLLAALAAATSTALPAAPAAAAAQPKPVTPLPVPPLTQTFVSPEVRGQARRDRQPCRWCAGDPHLPTQSPRPLCALQGFAFDYPGDGSWVVAFDRSGSSGNGAVVGAPGAAALACWRLAKGVAPCSC